MSSPTTTNSNESSPDSKFHFNSYNGRSKAPIFARHLNSALDSDLSAVDHSQLPNSQSVESETTTSSQMAEPESSSQNEKIYAFPSSPSISHVNYPSSPAPVSTHGSLVRTQQVVSQQSVMTTSTTSPRYNRVYSQSSDSSFSRTSSPLDNRPEPKSIDSRKNSTSSLRQHIKPQHPYLANTDSTVYNNSQRVSNKSSNGSMEQIFQYSKPTLKHENNCPTVFTENPANSGPALKAKQIPTDTTERIPSPGFSDDFNHSSAHNLHDESDRHSFSDSLHSPQSELGDLEDFVPEKELHADSMYALGNDASEAGNSFMNDETQVLVDKATSYKYPGEPMPSEDGSTIGVKKEKSVIDSLKQENFQLKLRIVIMESQLNASSSTGVADLRNRLVESEASRIAMKNENDKLRQTMASLDSEEVNEEKDQIKAHIRVMQEDITMYEQEREEFQQERAEFREKEEDLKAYYEQVIFDKKKEIKELLDRNDDLIYRLDEAEEKNDDLLERLDRVAGSDQNSVRTHSRSDSNVKHRRRPLSRHLHRVMDQVNLIRRTLTDSPHSDTSKNGHRISMSTFESSLADDASNVEAFSNLLKQIQASVSEHMADYKSALVEAENARNDYDELLEVYRSLKFDLENAVARNEAEAVIDEYEEQLSEKRQKVADLETEKEDLWDNIRVVNQGLAEIERERNSLLQLNAHLAEKNEELQEAALSQNPMRKELASLSRDHDELQLELEMKEKDLQSLNLELSNCEAELDAKNAEIKALQDRVKSLKSQLDRYIEDLEKDAASKPAITEDLSRDFRELSLEDGQKLEVKKSQELITLVLKGVQECYNKNATLDNLSEQINEVFDSVKEFDSIIEQLHEANHTNAEITGLIDEKDNIITDLNSQLEAATNDATNLQHAINNLENDLKTRSIHSESSSKKIEELEETIRSLELDLEAEEELRAELTEVRTMFDKTKEDLHVLNGDILDLESKNSELLSELEKEHAERDHLETEISMLREDFESTERILGNQNHERNRLLENIKDLNGRITDLEASKLDYEKKNKNLSKRMNELNSTKEELLNEIGRKNAALGDVVKERGKLSRDMELLSHSYSQETSKSNNLERQILSLVQATSASNTINASNAGAIFKQQTYHRMLELDKEVQTQREKMKALELDLQDKNQKYSKRGSDFFAVLSDILSAVSASSEKTWQSKISEAMDEIRRNPGTAIDNCKKLGSLIREGIKKIGDKCAELEDKITELKKAASMAHMGSTTSEDDHLATNLEEWSKVDDSSSIIKKPSQQLRHVSSEVMQKLSGTFVGQIWIYRYREMKTRFEKEREARKMEFDSYNTYVKQLEDEVHKYQNRYKSAVEAINKLQSYS